MSKNPIEENVVKLYKWFGGFSVKSYNDLGVTNYYISHYSKEITQKLSIILDEQLMIKGWSGNPKYVADHFKEGMQGVILTRKDVEEIAHSEGLGDRIRSGGFGSNDKFSYDYSVNKLDNYLTTNSLGTSSSSSSSSNANSLGTSSSSSSSSNAKSLGTNSSSSSSSNANSLGTSSSSSNSSNPKPKSSNSGYSK